MVELLWHGLRISILGMGLTFAALGLLIVIMMLLDRLTRARGEPQPAEETVANLLTSHPEDEKIVAAIAVALAYQHSRKVGRNELGVALETGHSRWWVGGQMQQRALSRTFLPKVKR